VWWLDPVSVLKADANEPIDHEGERQDGKDREKKGAAQESGKDLLLAEEERACCDEKPKAHAPEMARDALSAGRLAASEHANISGGGEHEDGRHKEGHAGGGVWVCGSGIPDAVDGEGEDGGCSANADDQCGPIKRACVSATACKPRSGDHVEGDDAADDVAGLGLQDCET